MCFRSVLTSMAAVALMAAPAHAQLLHSWNFNTNADDSFGALGTMFGDATVSGGTLKLDGVGDYVTFTSQLLPTSGPWTISFFANIDPVQTGYGNMMSQGSSGSGFYVSYDGGNWRLTDAWNPGPNTDPGDTDGAFHSYTLVNDGTSAEFYRDGTLYATRGNGLGSSGGCNFVLGAQYCGNAYNEFYHGELDEVRIFGNAMDADAVQANYIDSQNEMNPDVNATPEPASLVLLGSGLGAVGFFSRRRKS